ncbi:hypothetical protein T484DRAFT_2308138 [Baffinella frigidus]|nr:hypothetical protein T484DRAFT_2308138 [Cryptophyta sp. CCMP2293]
MMGMLWLGSMYYSLSLGLRNATIVVSDSHAVPGPSGLAKLACLTWRSDHGWYHASSTARTSGSAETFHGRARCPANTGQIQLAGQISLPALQLPKVPDLQDEARGAAPGPVQTADHSCT